MTGDRSRTALKIIAWLGAMNFLAFIIIDFLIGGDAPNGKVVDGRYYLDQHGTFTEVSHAVFIYSAVHAYSALAGLALAFWCARKLRQNPGRLPSNY